MNSTTKAVTRSNGWTIALFTLFLAGIGMAFSQIGESTPEPERKINEHPLEVTSGTFVEQTRHFQENDKAPVLQWIEQTRRVAKMEGRCVLLLKEKGSNADVVIPEMASFLRASGYQVSTDSVQTRLPKELLGLRFEVQKDCIWVHIGTI